MTTKYITNKRIADEYITNITTTISALLTSTKSILLVSRLLAMPEL